MAECVPSKCTRNIEMNKPERSDFNALERRILTALVRSGNRLGNGGSKSYTVCVALSQTLNMNCCSIERSL